MWRVWLLLSLGLMMGATPAQTRDSRMRVANEGTIGDKWKLAEGTQLAMPVYPSALAGRKADVCIALGYIIGDDGRTSGFTVLKQWSSEGSDEPVKGYWAAFAQAGADALSNWRFQHKEGAGGVVPTHTAATLAFNGGAGSTPQDLRGHCKIEDLASHLESLKDARWRRGDMNRNHLENERNRQEAAEIEAAMRRANPDQR